MYFKEAPTEIFEYLSREKTPFIEEQITPRAERIKYIHDDDLTEENIVNAEEFKKQSASIIFPHITAISHTLLKQYTDRINTEDAIRRTEALIEEKKRKHFLSPRQLLMRSKKNLF